MCFQQSFWNGGGYINSNSRFLPALCIGHAVRSDHRAVDHSHQRSGKDANSVLTSIHNFDPAAGCDANTFQPCSDRALRNHKSYVDGFRSAYTLNRGIAQNKGVATGRYTEDVYYNGNPWYLTTLAAAEQLFDAVYVWKKEGSVTVTSISLPFFADLVPGVTAGTYKSDSATYKSVVDAVTAYGDSFMDVVAKYTAPSGELPEQFDRNSGTPLGATHLTWSYAAFITAAERRAGIVPDGWGAEKAKTIPGSCNRDQVAGSYTSATKTSFPPNQTPQENASIASSVPTSQPTYACPNPDEVQVTFNEKATTQFGQTIKLVGGITALGNWNAANAVALSARDYSPGNPLWSVTVSLPASAAFEYKFINVEADGTITWESNPNRAYTVPEGAKPPAAGCSGSTCGECVTATVDSTWR